MNVVKLLESDLRDLYAGFALAGLLASRFARQDAAEYGNIEAVYKIVNSAHALAELMVRAETMTPDMNRVNQIQKMFADLITQSAIKNDNELLIALGTMYVTNCIWGRVSPTHLLNRIIVALRQPDAIESLNILPIQKAN